MRRDESVVKIYERYEIYLLQQIHNIEQITSGNRFPYLAAVPRENRSALRHSMIDQL